MTTSGPSQSVELDRRPDLRRRAGELDQPVARRRRRERDTPFRLRHRDLIRHAAHRPRRPPHPAARSSGARRSPHRRTLTRVSASRSPSEARPLRSARSVARACSSPIAACSSSRRLELCHRRLQLGRRRPMRATPRSARAASPPTRRRAPARRAALPVPRSPLRLAPPAGRRYRRARSRSRLLDLEGCRGRPLRVIVEPRRELRAGKLGRREIVGPKAVQSSIAAHLDRSAPDCGFDVQRSARPLQRVDCPRSIRRSAWRRPCSSSIRPPSQSVSRAQRRQRAPRRPVFPRPRR